MEGHNDLGLDDILRFRIEPDLKKRLAELARKKRKPTAQFLREVLWNVVEEEFKATQAELPLTSSRGRSND